MHGCTEGGDASRRRWTRPGSIADHLAVASDSPSAAAVIVAAGNSTRMAQAGIPGHKPLLDLDGAPILEHVCRAFDGAERVREVLLVVHGHDLDRVRRLVAERSAFAKVRGVVEGGALRADSVRMGAAWCAFDLDVICVHDAARPLVEPAAIDLVVERAWQDGAALLALAVRDTLKRACEAGEPSAAGLFAHDAERVARVDRTLDRAGLFAAQTPQAFRARDFRELLGRAEADGFRPTDDAALWERYRGAVTVVPGSQSNFKITTPEDLELAAALLALRREVRA